MDHQWPYAPTGTKTHRRIARIGDRGSVTASVVAVGKPTRRAEP